MAFINHHDIARGFVALLGKKGEKYAVKELAALVAQERLHNQLDEILAAIETEQHRVHGIVEATATSAYPLSAALKKQITDRVMKKTQAKKVVLHEEIDTSLLGGVIVSAPDMELDLSLRSKLNRMQREGI